LIPAAVLNLLVAILVLPLSYLEHKRSVRPSSILCTYFLFSFMFDIAQARTLYLLDYSTADVFSLALVLKLLLFIVESRNKSQFLKLQYEDLPPEATAGIVSRSFLWWLNALFSKGSKSILKFEELYGLDPELEAETVGRKMQRAWEKRCL
jgi:ATP-binding cassette subfamily C (CFTR/MRP) protein 1